MSCWVVATAEVSLGVGLGALAALVWQGRRDLRELVESIEEWNGRDGEQACRGNRIE